MNASQLSCPACGAALHAANNASMVKCEFCGKESALEYSQGQATVIAAERVGQAIASSNAQVSDTIRNTGDVTQLELKRLQLNQDISSTQMLLANVRSEIRGLERQPANKVSKKQLKELKIQEGELVERVKALQLSLVPGAAQSGVQVPPIPRSPCLRSAGRRGWDGRYSFGSFSLASLVHWPGEAMQALLSEQ